MARKITGFLLAAMLVGLLAGCGGTTAEPSATTVAEQPTAAATAEVTQERATTPSAQGAAPTAAQPATPTTEQVSPTEAPTTSPAAEGTAHTGALDKVRFSLDWTPNTNHTGIYVALAKGWYQQAGLDVQILPYSDANTPDTLVATGQAEFGISFEESMVTNYVSKLPVKSVAAVLQTNTSALVTLKDSGLDRSAKLEGKRYAGFGSPYEEPVIRTVLKADGAKTGDFRNVTTNLAGYQSLVAKQTDFVWIYMGWEGIQAKLDGVQLNVFMIKDYGVPDYYTPVIIANTHFLSDHGDVARHFLEATARGYEYGVTNPKDAADLLVKTAPAGTFSDPKLVEESQAYLAPYYQGKQPRWGLQTLDYWTNFPHFIAATGLLKTSDGAVVKPQDIDYSALFTNDYLPK